MSRPKAMSVFPPRVRRLLCSLQRSASALVVMFLACASADVVPAAPVAETNQLVTDTAQSLSVEVRGWLGLGEIAKGCSDGYVPLQFTVLNGGSTEAVISLRCSPGYGLVATMPRTRIVAPPGATVRSTVYIGRGQGATDPGVGISSVWRLGLYAIPGTGPRRDVECRVEQSFSGAPTMAPLGATPTTPPAGVVPKVLTAAASRRLTEARGSLVPLWYSEVDPATAPEDWRGWSMLRELVLTDDDWTTLSTPARRAMLEWLALGGEAILIATDADRERLDRLGLPAAQSDGRRRVGAGELIAIATHSLRPDSPADVPPFEDAVAELAGRPGVSSDTLWSGEGLARQSGFVERRLPAVAILTFLALLAIIAGPVNVLLLAGRGRPARIFWTTPAISLTATALLLGLMFFRDGVGGAGSRRTLCLLDPDRTSMAVIQEQFSRTGILLGTSFPIREPSWMQPRPVGSGRKSGEYLEIDGERRSGDWFAGRTDQSFTLQAVRPGRAQIELIGPADAPEVLSSLEVPIQRLLLCDEEGRWWKTGPLGAGERRRLEPAEEREFQAVQRDLVSSASPARRRAVERLSGLKGYAWAEVAEPNRLAIATLDAIRWTHDEAWCIGPFVRSEGR